MPDIINYPEGYECSKKNTLAFYRDAYNRYNEKVDSNTFTATCRFYCIDSFVNELGMRYKNVVIKKSKTRRIRRLDNLFT